MLLASSEKPNSIELATQITLEPDLCLSSVVDKSIISRKIDILVKV
jgi:hypothetical protein